MIAGKLLLLIPVLLASAAADDPPREWIDADTGHRVIRLSDEPGSGSFYFHQNGYAAGGDKLVFSTRQGLSTVNLKTRKIEPLVRSEEHTSELQSQFHLVCRLLL